MTQGTEEMKLDALAAATLAMDALGGPATADRRILLQLAVDVLRDTHGLNANTLCDIEEMVHLMELTVELLPLTEQARAHHDPRIRYPPWFRTMHPFEGLASFFRM